MHLAGIGAHQNGRIRSHVQVRSLPGPRREDTLIVPLPLPTSQEDDRYERATSSPDARRTVVR